MYNIIHTYISETKERLVRFAGRIIDAVKGLLFGEKKTEEKEYDKYCTEGAVIHCHEGGAVGDPIRDKVAVNIYIRYVGARIGRNGFKSLVRKENVVAGDFIPYLKERVIRGEVFGFSLKALISFYRGSEGDRFELAKYFKGVDLEHLDKVADEIIKQNFSDFYGEGEV